MGDGAHRKSKEELSAPFSLSGGGNNPGTLTLLFSELTLVNCTIMG